MNIFRRKEKQDYQLTNDDWQVIAQMMYRYINRNQNINPLINKTDYIDKAFMRNAIVYSILTLRAGAAKGIPWLVYKIKNTQKLRAYRGMTTKADTRSLHKAIILKEQSLEEVDNTPITKLLKQSNPDQTFQDIVEAMFIYRDTTGDAYLYQVNETVGNQILQLFTLPADKVKIVGGLPIQPIKGYRLDNFFSGIIPPEKVLHWKYFNPKFEIDGRQLYGLSPLVAASQIINSDNTGVDNEVASFSNEGVKGILTGIESTDIEYSKEQSDLLLKKLKKATERARAGEGNIAFNRAPLNYIKVGETPVDLGTLESRKYNKEVLCNVFHIHPSLLSSDASTLNNLKEARKALITMSVMPDMDHLREKLNTMFQTAFGEQYFVDYDIMAISELQDDLEKLSRTLQGMTWITDNEKRSATNYDNYDDPLADVLWTDMGKIPMGYGVDSGFQKIDNKLETLRQ